MHLRIEHKDPGVWRAEQNQVQILQAGRGLGSEVD
jgi:hypothetical protein